MARKTSTRKAAPRKTAAKKRAPAKTKTTKTRSSTPGKRAPAKTGRPPARTPAGEQVFGDNVDEVLADRIVERTRQSSRVRSDDPPLQEEVICRSHERHSSFRPMAALALLAGGALLLAGSLSRIMGKRKR